MAGQLFVVAHAAFAYPRSMELWGRLRQFELGWGGLGALVLAFVVALLLRRALPEGRRNRGKISVLLLGCAPVFHLVATGLALAGAPSASAALHLLNIVVVIVALTGVLTMVIFDLALGRTSVPTILRDFTQVAAFGALAFIVLHSGGLQPLSVLTTSAVATAIVGLALQGIMTNVLAGLALHVDRTLKLGDFIQWGQRSGTLVEIHWRATSILTREGDTVIVPNATLLSSEVLNLSRPTRARRTTLRVPVPMVHAPADVRRVLLGALQGIDGIRKEPAPTCAPSDMDVGVAPHLVHALRYWVDDASAETAIEEQVRERIWYAMQREGLQGPGPAAPAVPPS